MPDRVVAALKALDRLQAEYGIAAARRKLELLRVLQKGRLPRGRDVLRLHESLCFLRAYPDDASVLGLVERMLDAFDCRPDLRKHRDELFNSGVAGTAVYFAFFPQTASWLARHWGTHLTIDWDECDRHDKIEPLLPQLALYGETPGLDECDFTARAWIDRMKGPNETDAAFFLRRLDQLQMSPAVRESLLEDLDIPFCLSPGPDTPARTREKYTATTIAYQSNPLNRARPSIPDEIARPPRSVRSLSPRDGQAVIDLARAAMATRSRDLDAFAYGDRNDVRLLDCGNGLRFAVNGVIPQRRFLFETLYGFLMLKNGVPVGYGTYTGLFGSAEVAYTVFDTFRAGEAASMYGRALAIARHLFRYDTFAVDPYQLGQDNDDAVRSGAWWFYQKLGFRPRDAGLLRIMRRELKRMKKNRAYRSSAATLTQLATENVYLHLEAPRKDVLGVLSLANVGLRITDYLAKRFGHDRRMAERVCAEEAAARLGLRSRRAFTTGERIAWRRWSPLIMILPGLERWPKRDRQALIAVVRAKGARRESDYLLRFDRHDRLRRAIQHLAR